MLNYAAFEFQDCDCLAKNFPKRSSIEMRHWWYEFLSTIVTKVLNYSHNYGFITVLNIT